VDAAGAECLRKRIEQHQHWRQAQAVIDGRQPSIDPDLDQLETVDDGIRLYAERETRVGKVRPCKRLVDGFWQYGTIEQRHESDIVAAIAHVA
jgi:hypothetical protein